VEREEIALTTHKGGKRGEFEEKELPISEKGREARLDRRDENSGRKWKTARRGKGKKGNSLRGGEKMA